MKLILLYLTLVATFIFSFFTEDPTHAIYIITTDLFLLVLFIIEYIKQRDERKKRMRKIEKLKNFDKGPYGTD